MNMKTITMKDIRDIKLDSLESLENIEDVEERKKAEAEIIECINNLVIKKSNNIIAVEQEYKHRLDAIDSEIKRLTELKKKVKRDKENFESFVDFSLRNLEINKVETDLGTIKYRKMPLSVEIDDTHIKDLPVEFVRTKTVYEPDKEEIKKLYKQKGIKLDNVIYNDSSYKITIG